LLFLRIHNFTGMSIRFIYTLLAAGSIWLLSSCSSGGKSSKNGNPIVLGDTAAIITETDPTYLQDYVADFKPAIQDSIATAPAPTSKKDSAKPTPASVSVSAPAKASGKEGLYITFKDLSLFIAGIKTTDKKNPIKGNSATYELSSGNLNGNTLMIQNGTVQTVAMQYQTTVVLTGNGGSLLLSSLGHTGSWVTLKGSGNSYSITGLDENKLEYTRANTAAIRAAVTKAARAKRMNKRSADRWLSLVRNTRSVTQSPCSVALRTVQFRVDGKDGAGKSYRKLIRFDIPM
jgi:hypothetical protein